MLSFERLKEDIRNVESDLEYGEYQDQGKVAVNVECLRSVIDFANETIGKAIRRMQKSIVEEYEKQERKENMNIEDCKTLPEFFGVNIHDHIWVEGKQFKVYRDALGGEQSAPNEASRALVGCLTGQLKWSRHEPSEGEFGSCAGCGYEFNSELISEYEITHCPKCGRKIGEATEEIIVPAMTAEEENTLREIAAWFPSWQTLLLEKDGDIGIFTDYGYCNYYFGFAEESSQAYEVLAPILEKYGEINLDEYREKINE